MGRLIKTAILQQGAQSALLPAGATSSRPVDPTVGSQRFNTSDNKIEFWNGESWRSLAAEGTVTITKDTFTGDGSTTEFGAMSFSKNANDELTVVVYVGNVPQNPGVAYTFNGTTTISFTSPPPAAHTIVVLHGLNSTVAG